MWSWSFTFKVLPKLLPAAKITFIATILGFLLASILGLVFTLLKRTKIRWVSSITAAIVEFIRRTPLLIQLFFLYYTLPGFNIRLPALTVGIIGLGLHYSTYLSEVYRAGIESVEKEQWEAAKSLNFTSYQTWTLVILPQAIPPVIPMMGNYLITLFKETPLLAAISVVELLQEAKIIGSEYFQYLEVFTLVGVIFFIFSYPSSLLVQYLEIKFKSPAEKRI